MWEWEFILMYKIHCHLRTRLEKTQKKTIRTMYASCYTERHSVWYVVDYCKHILTDICYRVERKGQLCPQMANLSCTFVTLHVVQNRFMRRKPLSGENKSVARLFFFFKENPSTTSLHPMKNYADTREVNIKYLKTWQTNASVSGFLQSDKEKTQYCCFSLSKSPQTPKASLNSLLISRY